MASRFVLWRDKLLLLTLALFFLENSSYVRVALRVVLEGSSFGWGYWTGLRPKGGVMMAQGIGLMGDLAYLAAMAFIVLFLLWLGLRRPDRTFKVALALWTGVALTINSWIVLQEGHNLTHSRETLGQVNVPVDVSVLIWPAAAFVAALLLLARDLVRPAAVETRPWVKTNGVLLGVAVVLLAACGLVLNLGPQHGTADFIGMSLIYMGTLAALAGCAPWAGRQGSSGGD